MVIQKRRDGCYLLLKLSRADREFLRNYKKHETKKSVRNTMRYLNQMLAVHIRTVFVMQAALILEKEGSVTPVKAGKVFDNLDKSFRNYEKTVDRFLRKLGNVLAAKKTRKKAK